jgi:hypothetical protein
MASFLATVQHILALSDNLPEYYMVLDWVRYALFPGADPTHLVTLAS